MNKWQNRNIFIFIDNFVDKFYLDEHTHMVICEFFVLHKYIHVYKKTICCEKSSPNCSYGVVNYLCVFLSVRVLLPAATIQQL